MANGKRRNARRAALGIVALGAAWLVGVWPPPLWWRDHTPRCTAMMRIRSDCRTVGRSDRLVPLPQIAPALQRMVVIGEDSRFRTHHGLDFDEIRDAAGVQPGADVWVTAQALWGHRDRVRGASTITQQLAKNLYLSPSRSALRKLKEAVTAVRLELALPKDRILELYLNTAEWGPGIWGVEAASESYFGVPTSRLTVEQAAALAATLPFPRSSNPVFQPSRMATRRELILARLLRGRRDHSAGAGGARHLDAHAHPADHGAAAAAGNRQLAQGHDPGHPAGHYADAERLAAGFDEKRLDEARLD